MSQILDDLAHKCLSEIKQHCSPAIDRGDSHGAPMQSGRILWQNHEPFALQAIKAAVLNGRQAELNASHGDVPSTPQAASASVWRCGECNGLHIVLHDTAGKPRISAIMTADRWADALMQDDEFVAAVAARLGRN